MNWNLEHKRMVITGATKGIGRAVLTEGLALGAEILFTARNEEEVAALEQELRSKKHFAVTGIVGDIADPRHRKQVVDWVAANWGAVDVLVNNAGTNIRKASLDFSAEEFQKILDINLIGPFELSKLLHPYLLKGTQASVVNVASIAGTLDVKTGSPYAMSKAALLQQTKVLASEWAVDGIRVNAVSPWFTETPLTEGLLKQQDRLDAVIHRTPMKRVGKPEEIAAAILFLAMEQSSYITGQNLIVDGGMSVTAL